jgi:predicted DNA-binding WGR domain protein
MVIKKELQFLYNIDHIKVWIIILDNKKITINFGKKNTKLQKKVIIFESNKFAQEEYNKRIEEKIKKGYVEITNKNIFKIENINEYINFLLKISYKYCDYREVLYKKNPYEYNYYNNEEKYEKFLNKCMEEFHNKNKKSIEKQILFIQNKNIKPFNQSGVIISNIPKNIKNSVLKSINNFSDKSIIDYHPNSNNKVRDIVHPSLYPLITNIKKTKEKTDYWGRTYENSKYQWLPSEFSIDKDGKCKIDSYINNLPITETEIYNNIEKLFEFILPQFENIWSYIKAIKLYSGDILGATKDIAYKQLFLKNRKLQIITKIVKIELNNKDSLEGAWHVEGMSHENIVATASCTLEQDKNFDAKLMFKRKYTINEAFKILLGTCQNPPNELDKLLNEGTVPLGKSNIKDGSLIIFPNSHIHKIDMESKNKSKQTRTIIVFWLINPDIKIKSTKDIKQQNYNIKEAYKTRLKLMEERTLYKNSFNIRDLNLCEH